MTWMMKTMADTLSSPTRVTVQCGCGRKARPDMMADVTGFTEEERSSKGWKSDTQFICDSCREMAIRTGAMKLSDLFQSQGAPDDVLTTVRAYEDTL
jgi:hypothetical protein